MALRKFIYAVALLLVCANFVTAEEEPKPDYSSGFRRIHELGVPDVSSGTYVHLEGLIPRYLTVYPLERAIKRTKRPPKGSGWIFSGHESNVVKFVTFSGNSFWVTNATEKVKATIKDPRRHYSQMPISKTASGTRRSPYLATWAPVIATNDIKRIKLGIGQFLKGDSDYPYIGKDAVKGFLTFATLWHSAGETTFANTLVGKIQLMADDQEACIKQELSYIADARHSLITRDFKRSGNWQDYLTGIRTNNYLFGDSWDSIKGSQILESRIATRISGKIPEINGPGITPQHTDLLARLDADGPCVDAPSIPQLWLLPTNMTCLIENQYGTYGYQKKTDKPTILSSVEEIMELKAEALPLLAAMLRINRPLPIFSSSGNQYYPRVHYSSHSMSRETGGMMQYKAMQHPLTSGELARLMLRKVIPAEFDSDEALYESTLEWYNSTKTNPPIDIAEAYLNSDIEEISMPALSILSAVGTEKHMKIIEARILEQDSSYQAYEIASNYARARGEKAAAFVEKLAEAFPPEDRYDRGQLTAIKALMKPLPPIEQIIEQISGSHSNLQENSSAIMTTLDRHIKKSSHEEVTTSLLNAALKVEDPNISARLIKFISYLNYHDRTTVADAPKKTGKDIGKNSESWRALLNDDRKVTELNHESSIFKRYKTSSLHDSPPLSYYAAIAYIRNNQHNEAQAHLRYGRRDYGQVHNEAVTKTALGYLNGSTNIYHAMPAVINGPLATNLVEQLQEMPLDERREWISELPLHETVMIHNMLSGTNEANALVAVPALELREISMPAEGGFDELNKYIGKALSTNIISEVVSLTSNRVSNGYIIYAEIHLFPLAKGVIISAGEWSSWSETDEDMKNSFAGGGPHVRVFADEIRATLAVELKKEPAIQNSTDDDELVQDADIYRSHRSSEGSETLWNDLESYISPTNNVIGTKRIMIIGSPGNAPNRGDSGGFLEF